MASKPQPPEEPPSAREPTLPTPAEMLLARWQALQDERAHGVWLRSQPTELRYHAARYPELGEIPNYEPRQLHIAMARKRLRRLRDFVAAKFQGDFLDEHPAEREVYIQERQRLLDDLQCVGLDDGVRWVTEAVPERLGDLIAGERTWDHDGAVRLDEDLYQLVVREKLSRLEEVFKSQYFLGDGVDRIIREIDKATRAKNDLERARAGAVVEDQWNRELLGQWQGQPPLPPEAQELLMPDLLESESAPEHELPGESKKQKKWRVVIDPQQVQRVAWEMHDNPNAGERERLPTAQEVCDRLAGLGHRSLNEKYLRHQMHASGLGWPPPRPSTNVSDSEYSEYSDDSG